MSKPVIHAKMDVRRWGGEWEDYIEIHDFMDSSKAAFPDNRHRALTHTNWFTFVVEKVFGTVITNSAGREVSVREIAEQHILDDFGGKYIPTVQDFLENMEFKPWMNNGQGDEGPSSHQKITTGKKVRSDKSFNFNDVARD